MKHKRATADRILDYLATGRTLTRLQAISRFNCVNLPGRAYDLRKAGHRVVSEMVRRKGKSFAQYRLAR